MKLICNNIIIESHPVISHFYAIAFTHHIQASAKSVKTATRHEACRLPHSSQTGGSDRLAV